MGTQLLGHDLSHSKNIDEYLDKAVQEVVKISSKIEGVRDADPSKAAAAKSLMDSVEQLRGRPLFYKYIGSGVGRGPYVELEDGSIKLDLINGIGIHLMVTRIREF